MARARAHAQGRRGLARAPSGWRALRGLWDLPRIGLRNPNARQADQPRVVEQTLTHREVRVEIHAARASGTPSTGDVRWVAPAGLSALGLSSLARKSLGPRGRLDTQANGQASAAGARIDAGGGAE